MDYVISFANNTPGKVETAFDPTRGAKTSSVILARRHDLWPDIAPLVRRSQPQNLLHILFGLPSETAQPFDLIRFNGLMDHDASSKYERRKYNLFFKNFFLS